MLVWEVRLSQITKLIKNLFSLFNYYILYLLYILYSRFLDKYKYLISSYIKIHLILDTTSLSVHRRREDGSSDEVLKITTGSWGLQSITNEFETFVTKVIGKEKMNKIKTDNFLHYFYLIRNFEMKITTERTHDDVSKTIVMACPPEYIHCLTNDPQTSVEEGSCFLKYSTPMRYSTGRIRWTKADFLKFGDKVTKRVIEHIKEVLVGDMTDVETILLVGRLSNVVVNPVQKCFKTKEVVVLNYYDHVFKGACGVAAWEKDRYT